MHTMCSKCTGFGSTRYRVACTAPYKPTTFFCVRLTFGTFGICVWWPMSTVCASLCICFICAHHLKNVFHVQDERWIWLENLSFFRIKFSTRLTLTLMCVCARTVFGVQYTLRMFCSISIFSGKICCYNVLYTITIDVVYIYKFRFRFVVIFFFILFGWTQHVIM